MPQSVSLPLQVAIIGGGPAGLIAAEVLSQAGVQVDVFDAMPSVGRKFLLAGVGGMNITHSEPAEPFLSRYGHAASHLQPMLDAFGGEALREWVHGLGIETFVGSSGRVFPTEMKAAPLLRAWLARLKASGVKFHPRHRWQGWNEGGELLLSSPEGEFSRAFDATLLALGGASWAKLGSDGRWVDLLARQGVAIAPLQAANCGFDVAWSALMQQKYAGAPLKAVAASAFENEPKKVGEFVITEGGVEGSLVYALSSALREQINLHGSATLWLDLLPQKTEAEVFQALSLPRGADSMSNHLRRKLKIDGVKAALLHELLSKAQFTQLDVLAKAMKSLPVKLIAPRPIDEAISTAGGVKWDALTGDLMLKAVHSVFVAGEMIDWEAPTGGYLLTACFATGRHAAHGILGFLQTNSK